MINNISKLLFSLIVLVGFLVPKERVFAQVCTANCGEYLVIDLFKCDEIAGACVKSVQWSNLQVKCTANPMDCHTLSPISSDKDSCTRNTAGVCDMSSSNKSCCEGTGGGGEPYNPLNRVHIRQIVEYPNGTRDYTVTGATDRIIRHLTDCEEGKCTSEYENLTPSNFLVNDTYAKSYDWSHAWWPLSLASGYTYLGYTAQANQPGINSCDWSDVGTVHSRDKIVNAARYTHGWTNAENTCTEIMFHYSYPCNNPYGRLESASCTSFKGWAGDKDIITTPVNVRFYANAPPGNAGSILLGSTPAGNPAEMAVCDALTSNAPVCDICATDNTQPQCRHRFNANPSTWSTYSSINDGAAHRIYAIAENIGCGGSDTQLINTFSVTCAPPATPTPTPTLTPSPTPIGSPDCKAYSVHDANLNDTQLFTIDLLSGNTITALAGMQNGRDIEGIDIHPTTREIFATSGGSNTFGQSGWLFKINPVSGAITPVGATGYALMDGLSFNPSTGELWGSSDGVGIVRINQTTGQATMVNSTEGFHGIAWNSTGTMLYGVKDGYPNSVLKVYNPATNTITTVDANFPPHSGALDGIQGTTYLMGSYGNAGGGGGGTVNIFMYDTTTNTMVPSATIPTSFYDIESISWPDWCALPTPTPTPTPTTSPNSIKVNIYEGTNCSSTSPISDPAFRADITVNRVGNLPFSSLTFLPPYSHTFGPDPSMSIGSAWRAVISNISTGWSRTCPSVDYRQQTFLSPGELVYNFVVARDGLKWWQTVGGDVGANGDGVSNGNVTDMLPATEKASIPLMGSPLSDGILTHESGGILNWGTNPGAGFSVRNYIARSIYDVTKRDDYAYFESLYTDVGIPDFPGTDKPPSNPLGAWGKSGFVINSITWNMINAGENIVMFVDGDLTINRNIQVDTGGFLAFIVKGDVIVAGNVDTLQGVYIANNDIVIEATGTAPHPQFKGAGVFVGWNMDGDTVDGIGLNRDRGMYNSTEPGELFTYRPDLLLNAPAHFRQSTYEWREVAP